MFRLARERVVSWPVTIREPRDGGVVAEATIQVEFRLLTSDELERLLKAYRGGGAEPDPRDLLAECVRGWSDVVGDDGQPLLFSPEAFRRFLALPYAHAAIGSAIIDASRGEAARKN